MRRDDERLVAVPGTAAAPQRVADERRDRSSLDSRAMDPRYAPGGRRGALAGDVGGRGPLRGRRRCAPRRDLRDLRSAAERHGRRCTWATRSTARSRTSSSAGTGCAASTRSGSRATTTRASRRRTSSRRTLAKEGLSRHDIGREAFVDAHVGVARRRRRARSWASSAGSAARSTTRASASRWTTTTSAR